MVSRSSDAKSRETMLIAGVEVDVPRDVARALAGPASMVLYRSEERRHLA